MSDVYAAADAPAAPGPLRFTVTPKGATPPPPAASTDDPYAGVFVPYTPPAQAQGAAGGSDDPYKDVFVPYQAPSHEAKAATSATDAAARGVLDTGLAGLLPVIGGLAEAGTAGKTPEQQQAIGDYDNPDFPGLAIPATGLARVLHESFTGSDDTTARDAYERGRASVAQDQRLAEEEHPYAFLSGQLVGALTGPKVSALKDTSALGRIGNVAATSATQSGIYGAGSALGEGGGPTDVAKGALGGAAAGGILGAVGGAGTEAVGKIAGRVASVVRGGINPEKQAATNVRQTLAADAEKTGGRAAIDPAAGDAADAAGTPLSIMDVGGQNARDLARKSGNLSSDAWETLSDFTQKRFENQSPRIAGFIDSMFGGNLSAGADRDTLSALATKANRGAYAQAYTAGDRPIWSPELERLVSSPDVVDAMKSAATTGKTRAVAEGMGGFNPSAVVTQDGQLSFPRGAGGVPTYPNLQFWDYTYRNLRDAADASFRAGRNSEGSAIKSVANAMRDELDAQVPEYKAARTGASAFFGAQDASEAGQKFVMAGADIRQARQALAKMSEPERELFARGFASELADKVMRTGDTTNVLDKIFIDSHLARAKINLALGPDRASQLEALLRVESIVDRARGALGNSTTARQLRQLGASAGHGVAGAGAVGAFEAVKEHDFNPVHVLGAALTFGALRKGAFKIDEKVASRVAEMLVSNDPSVLAKGLKIVTSSPRYLDALRAASRVSSTVGADRMGLSGVAAGAYALPHLFPSEEPHPAEYSGYPGGNVGGSPQ